MFVLIFWLREFPLLAVANRFEVGCQFKDPLLFFVTFSAPNEMQSKGNLGPKGLSDNTKVDFGATKDCV